jgi:hypothetical protein
MFVYGLSSLVFWMLLMMAVFAVMRWSAWGGRRPHPYQGYGAPGPYDQPGSPPARARPPVWARSRPSGSSPSGSPAARSTRTSSGSG